MRWLNQALGPRNYPSPPGEYFGNWSEFGYRSRAIRAPLDEPYIPTDAEYEQAIGGGETSPFVKMGASAGFLLMANPYLMAGQFKIFEKVLGAGVKGVGWGYGRAKSLAIAGGKYAPGIGKGIATVGAAAGTGIVSAGKTGVQVARELAPGVTEAISSAGKTAGKWGVTAMTSKHWAARLGRGAGLVGITAVGMGMYMQGGRTEPGEGMILPEGMPSDMQVPYIRDYYFQSQYYNQPSIDPSVYSELGLAMANAGGNIIPVGNNY